MDEQLFLQYLREHSLEEGKTYIQEHISELSDHPIVGGWLEKEALHMLYTPFVSLKLAELLIFFSDHVGHLPLHALGLKAKGDALVQIGHYQAAIDALDAAGEEFLSLSDEGNWARSRISWVTAGMWLDHIEEALQQAKDARDIFLKLQETYWVCVIEQNIALIYYYTGRHQEALDLYESMLSIYPRLTDQDEKFIKRSIAIAEVNKALELALLGSFEAASHLYRHAYEQFLFLDEIGCIVNTEISLAELDYIQGYYGSALRLYYSAYDRLMHDELEDPSSKAELKLCIGNCLVKLNRPREACEIIYEAVQAYRASDISLHVGISLREYATALISYGRSKEALAMLDEALSLFNKGGFSPYAYAIKLQQAELLLDMGASTSAYEGASLVRGYFEAQGLAAYSLRAELIMVGALLEPLPVLEVQEEPKHRKTLQEVRFLCNHISEQAHR